MALEPSLAVVQQQTLQHPHADPLAIPPPPPHAVVPLQLQPVTTVVESVNQQHKQQKYLKQVTLEL